MPEVTVHFHPDNPVKSFLNNSLAHLRFALSTVSKNNGYFFNFKTVFIGQELHLDLEGITNKFDLIQRNGFQYFTRIAFKTGGGVGNWHSGDHAYVRAGKITHQYPVHGPVYYVYAFYIAAAN